MPAHDNMLRYSQEYIQRIITSPNIEPPDERQAGQHYGTLLSLYENHVSDGVAGALAGWNVLKKIYPHLEYQRKLINFHDLGNIPIPNYILPESLEDAPNYPIYRIGLNMLYGVPGSGKSFVAIDIAARLALSHQDGIVIYSAGEGVPGLEPRLKAWEKHYGYRVNNLYLWRDALPFMNADEVGRFIDEVGDKRPVFILVDTLARAMIGMNENDTRETGLFIQAVERIMLTLNVGVLFVHHTNKMGILRGSTALDGAMDSILKLNKEEELITLYNSLERGGKNKHREEAPPLHFRLLPVEVEGSNEATIVMSEKIIDDPDAKLTDNQVAILDALSGIGDGLMVKTLVDMTGIPQATVYRNLKKLQHLELIESSYDRFTITPKGDASRML